MHRYSSSLEYRFQTYNLIGQAATQSQTSLGSRVRSGYDVFQIVSTNQIRALKTIYPGIAPCKAHKFRLQFYCTNIIWCITVILQLACTKKILNGDLHIIPLHT